MRKLITGMKLSVDGKFEGPHGVADWVVGWSDDYDLMSQIDACVVGGAIVNLHEHRLGSIRPDGFLRGESIHVIGREVHHEAVRRRVRIGDQRRSLPEAKGKSGRGGPAHAARRDAFRSEQIDIHKQAVEEH